LAERVFLFLIGRFLKIISYETAWPNEPNLVGSIYGRFSIKIVSVRFIWPSGFGEDFLKLANQKQELPVVAMFVNGSG
jgi:hypothetical protein